MNPDPSAAFFPDVKEGELDLYSVLNLSSSATEQEIKSSYRRLALLSHPDKIPSTSSPELIEAATIKFQQIGYAYNVLKDEKRRERYDKTGRTDESDFESRSEDEWKEYFKELWKGEVSAKSIEEFKQKYQGSEEEKNDLISAYEEHSGDFELIVNQIMCSTIDDEPRFITILNEAINAKSIKSTKKWVKTSQDAKAKSKRVENSNKEASEAEAYAKELGVHDQLFGDKKANGSEKKKSGKKAKDGEELKALIQGRQANRMESLMDSLEAKYGGAAAGAKNKSKKRASKGGEDDDGKRKKVKKELDEDEPSEEAFQKARAEMEAKRAAKKSK